MTEEDNRAAEYRRQYEKRREFREVLKQKLAGNEYARRQLCLKTKPLLRGSKGDTSND